MNLAPPAVRVCHRCRRRRQGDTDEFLLPGGRVDDDALDGQIGSGMPGIGRAGEEDKPVARAGVAIGFVVPRAGANGVLEAERRADDVECVVVTRRGRVAQFDEPDEGGGVMQRQRRTGASASEAAKPEVRGAAGRQSGEDRSGGYVNWLILGLCCSPQLCQTCRRQSEAGHCSRNPWPAMKDGTRLYTGSHGDELGSHNNVQQATSFTALKGSSMKYKNIATFS